MRGVKFIMEMKTYYVSLVQCLIGKCIEVKASDIEVARKWASDNLGRIWCSVYETNDDMEVIGVENLGR